MPAGIPGSYKTYNCLSCGKESRFRHGHALNSFCSRQCQKNHEYNTFIEKWKRGDIDGCTIYGMSSYIRRYILEKFSNRCTGCGISNWRGNYICLTVDHIDGNGRNNKEENLTLLCPNCHSQTPTFAGKNKGKGTRAYRQKYDKIYLDEARKSADIVQ